MTKPTKRPVAKKKQKPQPATRVKLKKLTAKQVALIQGQFNCVPPDQWRLVADARNRSVKVKPQAAVPAGTAAAKRFLAKGSAGTVEVLFAVVQRTGITDDG